MNLKGLCLKLSLVVGVLAFSNSAFADFYNVNGHFMHHDDNGYSYYEVDGETHYQKRIDKDNIIIDNGHVIHDVGDGYYAVDGETHYQKRIDKDNIIIDNDQVIYDIGNGHYTVVFNGKHR